MRIDYTIDPPIYTAGRAIVSMSSSLLAGESTADYIIMPAAEIQESGTLIGFEYYTDTPGAVEFYVSILSCLSVKYIVSVVIFTATHVFQLTLDLSSGFHSFINYFADIATIVSNLLFR